MPWLHAEESSPDFMKDSDVWLLLAPAVPAQSVIYSVSRAATWHNVRNILHASGFSHEIIDALADSDTHPKTRKFSRVFMSRRMY